MTSLATAIYQRLRDDPLVASLVSGRIAPDQIAANNQSWPAVTYTLISDVSEIDHSGSSGLAQARYQFDCWADTDIQAEAVARAIRLALVGVPSDGVIQAAMKVSERSMAPDPTIFKRRRVLDIRIWHFEDQRD